MSLFDPAQIQFVDPMGASRRQAQDSESASRAQNLLAAVRQKRPTSSDAGAGLLADIVRGTAKSSQAAKTAADGADAAAVMDEARQLAAKYQAPASPGISAEHLTANAEGYVNAGHPGQADPVPDFTQAREFEQKHLRSLKDVGWWDNIVHGGPAGLQAEQEGLAGATRLATAIAIRDFAAKRPDLAAKYLTPAAPLVVKHNEALVDPGSMKELYANREAPQPKALPMSEAEREGLSRDSGLSVAGQVQMPGGEIATQYQKGLRQFDVRIPGKVEMYGEKKGQEIPGTGRDATIVRDDANLKSVPKPEHQLAPHYTEVVDPKTGNKVLVRIDAQGNKTAIDTGGKYHEGATAGEMPFSSLPPGNAIIDRRTGKVTEAPYQKPANAKSVIESFLKLQAAMTPKNKLGMPTGPPPADDVVWAELERRTGMTFGDVADPSAPAPQAAPAPAGAPAPAPKAGVKARRVFDETTGRSELR